MTLFRGFLILVLCVPLLGQAAPDPQIAWEADFDEALKAAKADGKPIFLAFIMENESANDQVAKTHFHDKEIVAMSRKFHCLVAAAGTHCEGTCSRFGATPCASHQKALMRGQTIYLKSPEVSAPQFLFIKPDGETILVRSVWLIGPSELLKKMKSALTFNDAANADDDAKRAHAEVDRLIVESQDNNAVKRRSALASLMSHDDPRIIDFLVKQTDPAVDEAKRLEAVDAMGARGNANALPVLLKLLGAQSQQMRNHVVISLEKLGMAEAAPALHAALKKENKDRIKGNIVRAIALCDAKTPDHLKDIVSMIGKGSQLERCSAIRAAMDIPLNDDIKKGLLAAAKDSNTAIRGMAYYALARHQVKDAIPTIEKATTSEKSKDVRNLALSALSMLKETEYEGPGADDLVKQFLADDDIRSGTQ